MIDIRLDWLIVMGGVAGALGLAAARWVLLREVGRQRVQVLPARGAGCQVCTAMFMVSSGVAVQRCPHCGCWTEV